MVHNTKSSGPADVTLLFVVRDVRVMCHAAKGRERERAKREMRGLLWLIEGVFF